MQGGFAMKNKKILFVYPEYPDTFWSYKHALKFLGKKAVFPPLGLLTVAAMLPGEWKKKLVDMNNRSLFLLFKNVTRFSKLPLRITSSASQNKI